MVTACNDAITMVTTSKVISGNKTTNDIGERRRRLVHAIIYLRDKLTHTHTHCSKRCDPRRTSQSVLDMERISPECRYDNTNTAAMVTIVLFVLMKCLWNEFVCMCLFIG